MRVAKKQKQTAIILLSGGLDSTVSLWWALKRRYRCIGLTFRYGQRHARELKSAKKVSSIAGIPLHIVQFKLPWSASSLTSRKISLPRRHSNAIGVGIPSTYVPGRNTIFLSFAMSLADQMKADILVIGANAVDYSGYPDCRSPYLHAFERAATLGSRQGSLGKKMRVVAPLVRLNKRQIVELGFRLGAPMDQTWSCYAGGARPCGVCDSCVIRDKGFREARR